MPLVKQELLTLPGHLSSISVLVGFVMLNHKRIMFKWIIVFVLILSAIVLSVPSLNFTTSDIFFDDFSNFS